MNSVELKTILEQHAQWLTDGSGQRANLQEADLQEANLQRANLRGADLRGANLDFSCLPLWCGSRGMKVDKRIAMQIAAHFCVLDCEDEEFTIAREKLLPFAQQSHRASELGLPKERVTI